MIQAYQWVMQVEVKAKLTDCKRRDPYPAPAAAPALMPALSGHAKTRVEKRVVGSYNKDNKVILVSPVGRYAAATPASNNLATLGLCIFVT
jgi:hypothetical protein